MEAVLKCLREAELQLKPSKCPFDMREIELLRFLVSAEGIRPQKEKLTTINYLRPPQDVKAVRSFFGMACYYRQCFPGFATLALPLTKLTKAKKPFRWGPEQQEAFDHLKLALTQAPVLAHPQPAKPYVLYTDASDKALDTILFQKDNQENECVTSYVSH